MPWLGTPVLVENCIVFQDVLEGQGHANIHVKDVLHHQDEAKVGRT